MLCWRPIDLFGPAYNKRHPGTRLEDAVFSAPERPSRFSDDSALHHRKVAVIPDKDEPGISHARDVCRRLRDKVTDLRYLELPDDGKDVTDWLDAGGTRDQLLNLIQSAPTWEQMDPEPDIILTGDEPEEDSETFVKLGDRDPDSERDCAVTQTNLANAIRKTGLGPGSAVPVGRTGSHLYCRGTSNRRTS